ncbi:MAG: hypothetical protein ACXW5U_17325 [Thermoanaerobaculia bacterium]
MAAIAMILALAGSAVAASREDRDRGRDRGFVKVVKKLIRALGDGLTVPLP